MVEVVDGWLANLHPNKPTWREIADVVDSIGHHDLAHSLRQVYMSGIPANNKWTPLGLESLNSEVANTPIYYHGAY